MNKLTVIFLCLVVGLGSGILGYASGNIYNNVTKIQNAPDTTQNLISRINSMPEGSEITITENELEKVTEEKEYNGASSEKSYFEWPGMWGDTAMTAAIGDQGIQSGDLSIGKSRGTSWVSGLWNFIKSVFWFLVLYFAVWLLLSALSIVYPPLGIIANVMAAIATGGISAIANIIGWVKSKKTTTALKQTVEGIDNAKKTNPEIKPVLNTELAKAQDSNTKDVVKSIRK